MEENENYQAVCNLIARLQNELTSLETEQQGCGEMRREIEEHFDKCIRAMEVRRDTLISQLELTFLEHGRKIDELKSQIRNSIQGCSELLKSGAMVYATDPDSADYVWQGAKHMSSLTTKSAEFQHNVQVYLPAELLDFINIYGTVSLNVPPSSSAISPADITTTTTTTISSIAFSKADIVSTVLEVTHTVPSMFSQKKTYSCLRGMYYHPDLDAFYVCSDSDGAVYKLTPQGDFSVFVESFPYAVAIAVYHRDKSVFVCNNQGIIIQWSPGKPCTTFVTIASVWYPDVGGIAIDQQTGDIYVSAQLSKIFKITPQGKVMPFAGGFTTGFADGEGSNAKFNYPEGLWFDETTRTLLVCDCHNNKIRKVSLDGKVSTLCEVPSPRQMVLTSHRTLLVSSSQNQIFTILPQETGEYKVEVLAGNKQRVTTNGKPEKSSFDRPRGIALHEATKTCFVSEKSGHIRKISFVI